MTIQKDDSANTLSIVDSATNADLTLTPKGTGVVVIPTLNASAISNSSILARNGGQTADVTINNTTTYTTGGITLAGQTAAANATWRISAFGNFVAASSVTARNARVACFWGSTQLTAISVAVTTALAQTTGWQVDFLLTGSSTTAMWAAGAFNNRVANAMQINSTSGTTVVTSGAQTIDLRFSMSTAVAGDQWVIQSVTIERLE